jgi:hypothetical protein
VFPNGRIETFVVSVEERVIPIHQKQEFVHVQFLMMPNTCGGADLESVAAVQQPPG